MNNKIVLTEDQSRAFDQIKSFVTSETGRVLILSGFAGTGKTTLMRMLVDWLDEIPLRYALLASTGRAAKILNDKVEADRQAEATSDTTSTSYRIRFAHTIHHHIYRFIGFNEDIDKMIQEIETNDNIDDTGPLLLRFNKEENNLNKLPHVYIIDEASMISDVKDKNPSQALFGSGRLLKDLLDTNPKGQFIFIGDQYQLPPVGQPDSPALSQSYLSQTFGIDAEKVSLTEIVRQAKGNDIVLAAERVRELSDDPPAVKWSKLPLRGYQDIELLESEQRLISNYISEIRQGDYSIATLICKSNRQCNQYAKTIRPALGFTRQTVMEGELLLVTQNNLPSSLRNGDLVRVTAIGRRERRAGLTFLHIEVKELASGQVYSLPLIEDILYSGFSNLDQGTQKNLFIDFHIRMKRLNIKQDTEECKIQLNRDPYLNALRAVYGYALTCHKAQGGEWPHVYVSIPRNLTYQVNPATYQWLYTAMTRASNRLYLVDDFYIDGYNNMERGQSNILFTL